MAFPPIIRNSQDRDADQSTPAEIWTPAHMRGPETNGGGFVCCWACLASQAIWLSFPDF